MSREYTTYYIMIDRDCTKSIWVRRSSDGKEKCVWDEDKGEDSYTNPACGYVTWMNPLSINEKPINEMCKDGEVDRISQKEAFLIMLD